MGVHAQAVQQLYIAYFSRPADVGGLIYWENIVNTNNGDTSSISAAFAKSDEYFANYGKFGNSVILTKVYLNLFGRIPEPEGNDYWSDLLDRKIITIDNVVTQVAKGAVGTDLDAYNAKVNGALIFTANLSPNTAPFYQGAGPVRVAENFITSIKDTSTLALATQTANLQTTFDLLVSSSYTTQTSTLSTGLDILVPTEETPFGGNDTFNANSSGASQTLNVADVINGGLGYNTLNLNSTTQTALRLDGGIQLSNIQNVNITTDNGATIFSNGWAGVKQLNVSSVGNTIVQAPATAETTLTTQIGLGSITVDGGSKITINSTASSGTGSIAVGNTTTPTGDINIHNTSNLNGNAISVKGGANILITQDYAKPNNEGRIVNAGAVTVTGSSATQTVHISNEGSFLAGNTGLTYIQNSVTVTDANFASKTQAGSISAVSISGFNNATIQDSALSTLNLFDGIGNVKIDLGMLTTAPTDKTLNLGLSAFNGSLDLSNAYSSVNIDTGIISGSNVFITSIQDTALAEITIGGIGKVNLSNLNSNTALKTINYTGLASITADVSTTTVTDIDTQNAKGSANFTIDGSKTTYIGGSGSDNLKLNASIATQSIVLGAGNDTLDISASDIPTGSMNGGDGIDTLIATSSQLDTIAANTSTAFSNFDGISITGAVSAQTLDAARLGSIQNVTFAQSGSYTIKNLANNSHISLPQGGSTYSFTETAHAAGKFNAISFDLTNNTSSSANFATGGIEVVNVEKAAVNIYYNNPAPNIGYDTLSLNAPSLATLTLSGNRGVILTDASTKLNSLNNLNYIDARGLTTGGLDFTGGTGIIYAYGSTAQSAANTVNLSKALQAITYTGGAGSDNVIVNGNANFISVGTGSDRVTITQPSTSGGINTIVDAHSGLQISFPNLGDETFATSKVVLGNGIAATFGNYADAAIKQSNGSTNGAFSWFQFGGSTYLVENRHSGSTYLPTTDIAVQLVGLFDLSKAVFSGENGIILA